jgi:hypothetical protein
MADQGGVHYDDSGLRRLAALFGGGQRTVRVGILTGPKMARRHLTGDRGEQLTNAEIGARHEYGFMSGGLKGHAPRWVEPRSFLFKPLQSAKARKRIVADAAEGLQRELARGQAVDAAGSFYGKLGAGLVATVQDSFDVSGPGWKPLSFLTKKIRRTRKVWPREGTKPLVDTGELRNAVSFRVMGQR